jgi:DNA-directed RNA polymerase sigma subunit (sigma70/sigma32)
MKDGAVARGMMRNYGKTPAEIWEMAQTVQWPTERERRVVEARFRDQRTLVDVAAEIETTVERVRQIEAKALRRMGWGTIKRDRRAR